MAHREGRGESGNRMHSGFNPKNSSLEAGELGRDFAWCSSRWGRKHGTDFLIVDPTTELESWSGSHTDFLAAQGNGGEKGEKSSSWLGNMTGEDGA